MAPLLTSSSSLKLDHVNSIYKQTITLRSSVSKKTHKNDLIFIGISNISKNIRGNLVRKAQPTCVMTYVGCALCTRFPRIFLEI